MNDDRRRAEFALELRALVNKHSLDAEAGTPDFIIADYLTACFAALSSAIKTRTKWGTVPVSDEVASGG